MVVRIMGEDTSPSSSGGGGSSTPSTSAERIAQRQAEVQAHRESFVALPSKGYYTKEGEYVAGWEDIQKQQAEEKRARTTTLQLKKLSEAREKVISGLSYEVKRKFIEQALREEKAELYKGTKISALDIGSLRTIRTKFKEGKPTKLQKKEQKDYRDISRTFIVPKETKQLIQISKKEELIPIRTYGEYVERETAREYKEIYKRRIPTGEKWKEEIFAKKWGESFIYYPRYQLEKIPGVTSFAKGYREELKEHPYRTLAYTGVGFIAPSVFGLVGKGSVALIGARATTIIGKGIGIGLTTVYGIDISKRVLAEPTFELKAERIGRIVSGEITPLIIGAKLGSYTIPKVSGWWRTRGRIEIPAEKVIPKEVLEGKQTFPTAPVEKHYKLFMEETYRLPEFKTPKVELKVGDKWIKLLTKEYKKLPFTVPKGKPMLYHATAPQFWETGKGFKTLPGTSELPGLFGAPGISPHFTRVPGGVSTYTTDIFNIVRGKPGVAGIIPKKFKIGAYTWKQFIAGAPYEKGVAYVPGTIIGKTEVQALIPPFQEMIPYDIGKKYFFRWKGVRIPIDVFKPLIKKVSIPKKIITMKDISKSYYLPSTYKKTPSILLPPIVDLISKRKAVSSKVIDIKLRSDIQSSIRSSSKILSSIVLPPKSIKRKSLRSDIRDISRSITSIEKKSSLYVYPKKARYRYPLRERPSYAPSKVEKYSYEELVKRTPPPPPPKIPDWDRIIGRKILKKKKKKEKISYYIPDFTSKALGLNVKLSEKQMRDLLKVKFSGLEIRPGVL